MIRQMDAVCTEASIIIYEFANSSSSNAVPCVECEWCLIVCRICSARRSRIRETMAFRRTQRLKVVEVAHTVCTHTHTDFPVNIVDFPRKLKINFPLHIPLRLCRLHTHALASRYLLRKLSPINNLHANERNFKMMHNIISLSGLPTIR